MNFSVAFEIFGAAMEGSHLLDLVGNAAPLIAFCAYLVKDIIWLRTLTIISAATWLLYLFSGSHILWLAAFWNAAFIVVNLGRIRLFNSVNLELGYPMIEIRTPKEVLDHAKNL